MNANRLLRRVRGGRRAAPVLLLAALLGGCASSSLPGGQEVTGLDRARERFAQEDYRDVIVLLTGFLREDPGTRYLDEATFLLGKAYYEEGEYLEAETRFRSIIRDFPESAYAVESSYHLGLSLLSQSRGAELDQTETLAARQQFESFVRRYPEHPLAGRAREHLVGIADKLARKEFMNARTYVRRGFEESAIYYLEKKVVVPYPETTWARDARFQLFDIYRKRYERAASDLDLSEAVRWGQRALEGAPDAREAQDVRRFLAEHGAEVAADSTGSP